MKLKVMTFNLRIMVRNDGINCFDKREHRVIETIRKENPDLIGFQEGNDYMKAVLNKNLSDTYVILGCGREKNYRGESASIAYRRDLFELVSFESFWLSSTPNVPGSHYENTDQSGCPRITSHAELSAEGVDEPIHFFNTHLDHLGERAKLLGAVQIMQKISGCTGKFVLTGDFNAFPDSDAIRAIKAFPGRTVHDTTEKITHTFHDFGRIEKDYKIDYIFTDATPISDGYAVEDEHPGGMYISDHYPVCAEIDF